MSLNFVKTNIYGQPVIPGVVTQLNKRKEIISKRVERTPDDVTYLTSNTGWVRITSAVDIDNSPEASKQYQLFKGIATKDKGFTPIEDPERSSYTESSEYGYVPTPGVTNFEVITKGEYGTLRLANVTFAVNSPDDFSILEQLYLRPGHWLLLEWGHSVKVSNEGEIDSNITYYNLDDFSTKQTIPTIKNRILELREENDFNYDGLFGRISNFSWTYNGSNYLCTVDVVSNGEVISSILNENAPTTSTNDDIDSPEYNANNFSSNIVKALEVIETTPIESFYSNLPSGNVIPEYLQKVKDELKKVLPDFESIFSNFRIIAGNLGGTSNNSSWVRYIRLRDFLNLINVGGFIYDENNINLLEFETSEETTQPFTTFTNHIGVDPSVCVLPKKGKTKYNIGLAQQNTDLEDTDLLNIFVNTTLIKQVFTTLSQSQNITNNSVFTLVESILIEIQNNLGAINSFFIAYDDDTDKYHIVDTSVIPSNDSFEIGDDGNPKAFFDLVGLKSEVQNVQVTSDLSEDISNMIAIAATRIPEAASLENIINLQSWNEGLKSRHVEEIRIGTTKTKDADRTKNVEDWKVEYEKFFEEVSSSNIFYISYDREKFNGYRNIHKFITREELKEITESAQTNYPGLIPFVLNFTVKGISGIKVLQSFKVNEFFLPERYRGRTAFMIRGLDHRIVNGQWVTEIKAYFVPI